eukprot:6181193-Pleurochrysis_carterae.AAC.2
MAEKAPWLEALGTNPRPLLGSLCACAPDLFGAGALWAPQDGWADVPNATPNPRRETSCRRRPPPSIRPRSAASLGTKARARG